MQSLLKRTVALSISRFANQAIAILGPILLVRLLPVDQFGSYREFLLYSSVLVSLILFGIPNSLTYFIPRYPERERNWLTQTVLVTLAATLAAIVVVYLARDVLRANTSFDFVLSLQLYLFFFITLDHLEYFWLARKRTDLVLFYSLARLSARLGAVVLAAWLTEDANILIWALIGVEAARFAIVLCFGLVQRWFSLHLVWKDLKLQASYFVPLGVGGVFETLATYIGMLFVSVVMGPEALAMYVIGAFVLQIVNILRGTIADVIFPEIVGLRAADPRDMLPLWQKATIWYGVTLFPMAVLLFYYAEAFVTVLFTSAYAPAIPVFAVLSLMLYVNAFDFHLPLRARNANRHYVRGTILAALINVIAIYPLYLMVGLIGPAFAFLISRLAFTVYLGHHTIRLYGARLEEILPWPSIAKIFTSTLICAPLLIFGKLIADNHFVWFGFGITYLASVMLLIRWLGVWDFWPIALRLLGAAVRRREHTSDGSA